MKATFSHQAPTPAFGTAPADRVPRTPPSRCQGVDSLVTLAVIAWFAVALAGMAGGTRGDAPAAGTELRAALPQAATSQGDPVHPRMRLI